MFDEDYSNSSLNNFKQTKINKEFISKGKNEEEEKEIEKELFKRKIDESEDRSIAKEKSEAVIKNDRGKINSEENKLKSKKKKVYIKQLISNEFYSPFKLKVKQHTNNKELIIKSLNQKELISHATENLSNSAVFEVPPDSEFHKVFDLLSEKFPLYRPETSNVINFLGLLIKKKETNPFV